MKALILVLLLATCCFTQAPKPGPTLKTRYPKGFEIRTSIYALDTSYVFNYDFADMTSLKVEFTWGKTKTILGEQGMLLPDSYKLAKILRFQTSNALLEVVGFNRKTKNCLLSIFWENGLLSNAVLKLSIQECKTLRVTKIVQNDPKLVTYITAAGDMMYFILENQDAQISTFKKVKDGKVYTKNCLLETERHEITQLVENKKKTDMLFMYSTNADPQGKYPSKICYLSSNTIEGFFTKDSTLSLVVGTYGYIDGFKAAIPASHKIITVNHQGDGKLSYFSGLWVGYEKPNGERYLKFTKFDVDDFRRTYKQGTTASHTYPTTFGIGYVTAEVTEVGVTRILTISQGGALRVGKPTSAAIGNWRSPGYNTSISGNIPDAVFARDEFITDVTRRKDNILVISSYTQGDIDSETQIIYNLGKADFPGVNTNEFFYRAKYDKIYKIQKSIGKTDQPKVIAYEAGIKSHSKRIYLINKGDSNPNVPITLTASDKSGKVSHDLQLNFVKFFVKDSISQKDLFVSVSKKSVKKIVVDYNEEIKYAGDVMIAKSSTAKTWFSFTPIKIIVAPPKTKPKSQVYSMRKTLRQLLEEHQLTQTTRNPIESLVGCTLSDYTVFEKSSKIHSFGLRENYARSQHFFVIDLQEFKIPNKSMRCLSDNDVNLVITKSGTNTYTALSFDFGDKGRFAISKFYSPIDVTKVKKVFLSKTMMRYKLILDNGAELFLFFNKVFPQMKIDSVTTTSGTSTLLGKKVTFDVDWA